MCAFRSLCAFLLLLPIALSLSGRELDADVPIRIGYVTFDKTPGRSENDVVNYLSAVARLAQSSGLPFRPRFQIYSGNYYQVMSWLSNGDLDGAVLSPFMTFIVLRQFKDAHPVVEFAGSRTAAAYGGTTPGLAAFGRSKDSKQVQLTDPIRRYDDFLRTLLRTADTPAYENVNLEPYAIYLVNHLSTSGFMLPLIYTHKRIETLAREGPERQEERDVARKLDRFWNLFFEYTHLTLAHDERSYEEKTAFRFGYAADAQPGASPYLTTSVTPNPNDVLVFRSCSTSTAKPEIDALLRLSEASERFKGGPDGVPFLAGEPGSVFRKAAAALEEGWTDRDAPLVPDKLQSGHRTATAYNFHTHQSFAAEVNGLFGLSGEHPPPPNGGPPVLDGISVDPCVASLQPHWQKWYEAREYEFSVDELFHLIAYDGDIRRGTSERTSVALVLPGGGVRGVYQATLLDRLYHEGYLVNARDHAGSTSLPPPIPLVVRQVIGTSGGALVGYFAAQRVASRSDALRRHWIRNDQVVATPLAIFPLLGLPRWLSIVVVLIIFAIVSAATFGRALIVTVPDGDVPVMVPIAVFLSICTGPFLLWHLASAKQDYTPTWEGLLYLLVIMVAHFLLTTTGGRPQSAKRRWNVTALVTAAAAAGLVVFIVVRDDATVLSNGIGVQSALAFVALLMLLGAAFTYTIPRGLANRAAMRAYAGGVVAMLGIIAAAFGVLYVGIRIGAASWLELTWEYWIWIGAGAVMAATFACGYVELFPTVSVNRQIHGAVTFWSELHAKRRLLRTPAESLIFLCASCLLLWAIFAAPAFYSGAQGEDTFNREVLEFNHGHDLFLADFVVTATSLGTPLTGAKDMKSYAAGDYYCCLGEQEGCKRMASLQQQRVIAFGDGGRFRTAVLASGAPFPIYPARRVDQDDEHSGMFIDGGYTHDTPIEAAQVLGADEVLIIHSAQRIGPEHKARRGSADRRVGALAYDAAGLFPFLFDRSQAVDQEVRAHMFVASLAPSSQPGRDPVFLMDFRDSTVRALDDLAGMDFERHRIGQIESWGLPRRLVHDTRFDECPQPAKPQGGTT